MKADGAGPWQAWCRHPRQPAAAASSRLEGIGSREAGSGATKSKWTSRTRNEECHARPIGLDQTWSGMSTTRPDDERHILRGSTSRHDGVGGMVTSKRELANALVHEWR